MTRSLKKKLEKHKYSPTHLQIVIAIMAIVLLGYNQSAHPQPLTPWKLPDSEFLSNDIQAIATEPGQKALWFGTWNAGASRYDLETGEITSYSSSDGLADGDVYAIEIEPGDNAIWLGTWGGGASRYDLKSGTFVNYTNMEGLRGKDIMTIAAEPGEKALWFGTFQNGASRFDLSSKKFTEYSTEDGLGDDEIRVIHADPSGDALWFGTFRGGVSRYDLHEKNFTPFEYDGKLKSVLDIQGEPGGNALWFGTYKSGAIRYDIAGNHFTQYTTEQGLASNWITVIQQDPHGKALWFGTGDAGVSHMDLRSGEVASYDFLSDFLYSEVHSIYFDASGQELWLGTGAKGPIRLNLDNHEYRHYESIGKSTSNANSDAKVHLLIDENRIARATTTGTILITELDKISTTHAILSKYDPTSLALGSPGKIWTGSTQGLRLKRFGKPDLELADESNTTLSSDVRILSTVPKSAGKEIWVGTSSGAMRVTAEPESLEIDCIANLPEYPVTHLLPIEDGSVFVSYEIITPNSERRTTRIHHISSNNCTSSNIIDSAPSDIQDLAILIEEQFLGIISNETLFAATTNGLYYAKGPRKVGSRFEKIDLRDLEEPSYALEIDDRNVVWIITNMTKQEPDQASESVGRRTVVGYRPSVGDIIRVTEKDGLPESGKIENIGIYNQELVIMIDSELYNGLIPMSNENTLSHAIFVLPIVGFFIVIFLIWKSIFQHPMALRIRKNPHLLTQLPLHEIPGALRILRRSGALQAIARHLRLSKDRIAIIEEITTANSPKGGEHLSAFARLLGMSDNSGSAQLLREGLWFFEASLPNPGPLRGYPTALFSLDYEVAQTVDPATIREAITLSLKNMGHRFELPFIVLCREPGYTRRVIPKGQVALIVSDIELRQLLFAESPQQVFAGLLLARDLLALSPYQVEGEVASSAMFYGRTRLLRELMTAPHLHFLLVGPRRVGKSSVLYKLLRELPLHRPEFEAVFLNLTAISDAGSAAVRLAREIGIEADITEKKANATLFSSLLVKHFNSERTGVVLIDEADALVENDARAGYPLLSELRALQAEGICSFVMTGYWYLYHRTLEHGSPLYNFAPIRRLGPLEKEAGCALAVEPMSRLGLDYFSPHLPEEIVECTGGYPDLIQKICYQLTEELRSMDTLTFEPKHVERAKKGVQGYLTESFNWNALEASKILVYSLLERDTFTLADAHQVLESAVRRQVPISVPEQLLVQLTLYGIIVANSKGQYQWTIPLLRDTLLHGEDRGYRIRRLIDELPDDSELWMKVKRDR